ncbi:MAG: hypothetical protein WBM78_21845 [Desulfobacterales bacterium]
MGQVTIYIDAETEKILNQIVKNQGISKSRWISDLIKEKTTTNWPEHIKGLAGAWRNFPLAEELRAEIGEDTVREKL